MTGLGILAVTATLAGLRGCCLDAVAARARLGTNGAPQTLLTTHSGVERTYGTSLLTITLGKINDNGHKTG